MALNFSNYTPQSVSDKGKTHEETFSFTRASLRSLHPNFLTETLQNP